jgi:hypothetical protein
MIVFLLSGAGPRGIAQVDLVVLALAEALQPEQSGTGSDGAISAIGYWRTVAARLGRLATSRAQA